MNKIGLGALRKYSFSFSCSCVSQLLWYSPRTAVLDPRCYVLIQPKFSISSWLGLSAPFVWPYIGQCWDVDSLCSLPSCRDLLEHFPLQPEGLYTWSIFALVDLLSIHHSVNHGILGSEWFVQEMVRHTLSHQCCLGISTGTRECKWIASTLIGCTSDGRVHECCSVFAKVHHSVCKNSTCLFICAEQDWVLNSSRKC